MSFPGEFIKINASDGFELDAYYSQSFGASKGRVIVAMEVFGVNDHIKRVADGYADAGYDALAPALFDRYEKNFLSGYPPDDVNPNLRDIMGKMDFHKGTLDIQGCINFLQGEGSADIGIVGYCYGGAIAWASAANCNGLAAAVSYYGTRSLEMLDQTPKCPTMMHWGRKDEGTPEDKVAKLIKAHPGVTNHWYDAGHGFNCDERGDYDKASAKLALERTLGLFAEHMG